MISFPWVNTLDGGFTEGGDIRALWPTQRYWEHAEGCCNSPLTDATLRRAGGDPGPFPQRYPLALWVVCLPLPFSAGRSSSASKYSVKIVSAWFDRERLFFRANLLSWARAAGRSLT